MAVASLGALKSLVHAAHLHTVGETSVNEEGPTTLALEIHVVFSVFTGGSKSTTDWKLSPERARCNSAEP